MPRLILRIAGKHHSRIIGNGVLAGREQRAPAGQEIKPGSFAGTPGSDRLPGPGCIAGYDKAEKSSRICVARIRRVPQRAGREKTVRKFGLVIGM